MLKHTIKHEGYLALIKINAKVHHQLQRYMEVINLNAKAQHQI